MNIIKAAISRFGSEKQPVIKYVGYSDDRLISVLNFCKEPLEQLSKNHKIPLTIAQRDDLLLINSGVRTAAFNFSEIKTPSEIVQKVYDDVAMHLK